MQKKCTRQSHMEPVPHVVKTRSGSVALNRPVRLGSCHPRDQIIKAPSSDSFRWWGLFCVSGY